MHVAGKQQAELTERPASLLLPTSTKSGIALLYNVESSNTYDVCLRLSKDALTIQKLDVVCTTAADCQHRTVVLRRQAAGGLGLSIKGGAEHNVPVVISKIFKDQVADQTGKLFVGDAVLQVNGINVERCTHKEVVHLLRTAGDEVTISVRYLREVPSFLKLPLGSPGPDHGGVSSPLFDSGFHLNGTNAAPSPPSPSANQPKYEKRWLDAVCMPLLMARVSRFKAGTDKLRSNCFEVFALDGASTSTSTSVLQFCTAAESTDWLQAISTNINGLTQENIKFLNKSCSSEDQIIHMGWACETPEGSTTCRSSVFRFLALRGPYFYIFKSPPIGATDWGQAETTYHLYEVLFKVHKLWMTEDCWLQARLYLGLEHSPEQQDSSESLCFSILVGHGQSHTFRVELATDLALWEKSFQRAVYLEVQRVRSKSYMCSSQGNVLSFTIDFGSGFTCSDVASKAVLWRYKFSQLKGSSDDGKTRVKLLFKNAESNQIEMKELEFANLTAVLHCIHSFIAAKVASMDPRFMCSQSFPGHYMNT
ncbi:gamma-2-syntrophin isoform X2 [Fundulus heteroclitus]|uniref:gamma-2-syntrophin isoform X2 n=1 Tax=Fundulus heteroclitus TaxID=8078 RepID=UPI00165AF4C4|nr:gamma-2-syntrophin isoform X2 [Fundulus heteroclitus]